MVVGVLLFSAATTLVVAAAYLYLASRLAGERRTGAPGGPQALSLFAAWWGLTGINQVMGGLLYAAAAFGYADLTVQTTYVVVQRLLLSGSMFGLMAYLLYLFRGRMHLVTLALVYGAFYAFQLWTVFSREPTGVLLSRWRTDLTYASSAPAWADLVTFLVVVLPPVVGCLAYLRLLARVGDRSARVRIFTVSIGLIVWWVFAVAVGRASVYDNDALQLANRVLGLVVAVSILFAFWPLAWMQRVFRLKPYASST